MSFWKTAKFSFFLRGKDRNEKYVYELVEPYSYGFRFRNLFVSTKNISFVVARRRRFQGLDADAAIVKVKDRQAKGSDLDLRCNDTVELWINSKLKEWDRDHTGKFTPEEASVGQKGSLTIDW